MRVPPQHELLYNEENTQPNHHGSADGMSTIGSYTFHRLWEQPKQRRADQRSGGEAHEVWKHACAHMLGE